MRDIQNRQDGGRESGNVLFLILIAVALFAALSYAVTQSTRSGSGDATGETNLINSAQLTQYPAGLKTSIIRMVFGGTETSQLLFNPPADFSNIPANEEVYAVFHPKGGGAVFSNAPADLMAAGGGNANGRWAFNANVQVQDIGITDSSDAEGNELIAFLPGITQSVCRKLNQEVGITADASLPEGPAYTPSAATQADFMDDGYTFPTGSSVTETLGDGDSPAFQGQPFGCYENGGVYIYYHVLVER